MILHIAALAILVYTSASLFLRSPWPLWVKGLTFVFILLGCAKFLIYQGIGGAFFAPDLPRPFLLVMETLYGVLILLTLLLLYCDLARLALWLAGKAGLPLDWLRHNPVLAHVSVASVKTCLAVLAVVLGLYGSWAAVRVPDVKRVELRLPNLPAQLDGLRIVQLTDLHLGQLLGRQWLDVVVDRVNALKPDIVALTGDYIDGHVDKIGGELAPLGRLQSAYGIFGVTGNHEYYWHEAPWTARLRELGITMLHNEHRVVHVNGEKLVVGGMPDPNEARFGGPGPDIAATYDGAPGGFRLLLEHQPRHARDYAAHANVPHLMLCGHTHGGMTIPLQPIIACFNKGFVNGLYDLGETKLYVSAGTALWSGFSSRVGVPSEITEFVLRQGNN